MPPEGCACEPQLLLTRSTRRCTGAQSGDELLVLIPIYNDWAAAGLLLRRLDEVLADAGLTADVLLVDDGATVPLPDCWPGHDWRALGRIDVLSLRRNVGHQRAIAIALAFVDRKRSPHVVVVMDGDGEDAPEDVPRLLACLHQNDHSTIVFAERTRRSESAIFRVFYALYRWAHRLLTGIPVRVGNFSVVPFRLLRRLVVVSELWNHYAAAVFKARLPRACVPTERAPRLAGKSRINFVDLVMHGLSALSVHSELSASGCSSWRRLRWRRWHRRYWRSSRSASSRHWQCQRGPRSLSRCC